MSFFRDLNDGLGVVIVRGKGEGPGELSDEPGEEASVAAASELSAFSAVSAYGRGIEEGGEEVTGIEVWDGDVISGVEEECIFIFDEAGGEGIGDIFPDDFWGVHEWAEREDGVRRFISKFVSHGESRFILIDPMRGVWRQGHGGF